MTSEEKIAAFKLQLVDTDEVLDGPLGMLQGMAGAEAAGFGHPFSQLFPDDPETLDAMFLDIARFSLWIRSDDAETPALEELLRPPELVREALGFE